MRLCLGRPFQIFRPWPWACGEVRAARPDPRPVSPPPSPCVLSVAVAEVGVGGLQLIPAPRASPNGPQLFLSVIHSLGNSECGRRRLGKPAGPAPCRLWDTLVDPALPSVHVHLSFLLPGAPLHPAFSPRVQFWKTGGRGLPPCSCLPPTSLSCQTCPLPGESPSGWSWKKHRGRETLPRAQAGGVDASLAVTAQWIPPFGGLKGRNKPQTNHLLSCPRQQGAGWVMMP